jgi:membrane protein YdbS with pleckstrin-like domain
VLDWARKGVLAMLRVPPEPQIPEGSRESVLTFRAGRNFYRWQVLAWAAPHLGLLPIAAVYVFGLFRMGSAPFWVRVTYDTAGVLALIFLLAEALVTFLALKWSYELRWYIVTDRSLRIRSGVWNVEELTMTFANIQEIRVASGPIQKYLGLADVEVRSAGGGAAGPRGEQGGHTASFEGVDNANEIRDLIVNRLRAYRDLGLGGVEHHESEGSLTAAHAVLEESRALRRALEAAQSPMTG